MNRVKFYLKNNNQPKKSIVAHIFLDTKEPRLYYYTREAIHPDQWDYSKQRAKIRGANKAPGAAALNSYLDSLENDILTLIRTIRAEKTDASYNLIKEQFEQRFKKNYSKTFNEYFTDYLNIERSQKSKSTYNIRVSLQKLITNYSEIKQIVLTLDSINLYFWENFYNYLILEKKLRASTCNQYLTVLKVFMMWSFERGLHQNLEFKKFKLSVPTKEIVYLEPEELQRLIDINLTDHKNLDQARDLFLFGCFTGARYSDISTIDRADIQNNIWHLRTHKTKTPLKVPLNNIAITILEKYRNSPDPLPVLTIQKAIKQIQKVCKLAGIDTPVKTTKYIGTERIDETKPKFELMGTHTARRTFVTLSILQGMKPETVMKITGHSDYKTMQKYLNITNKEAHKEYFKAWGNPNLSLVENQ